MGTNWIDACLAGNRFVDEKGYLVGQGGSRTKTPTNGLQRRQTLPAQRPCRPAAAPPLKACVSAVSSRRSDAASARLNPNGVFRGLCISIYGIDDTRVVQSISHQVVDNGGMIVNFMSEDQYACICLDGIRPMHDAGIQLVSTRWVNDCLAHGELLEPSSKKIYIPSKSQMPLLIMRRICIYTPSPEDPVSVTVKEIAKVCGIPCFDIRDKLNSCTHIILSHTGILDDLPKRFVQRVVDSKKHIVSSEWLEDTFLSGTVQDEKEYYFDAYISNVPSLLDK